MDDALRNSLWNLMAQMLWDTNGFMGRPGFYSSSGMKPFSRWLWAEHYRLPADSRPRTSHEVLAEIRDRFFAARWHAVYDFVEFVGEWETVQPGTFAALVNLVLDAELAGYRMIDGRFVEVTDALEVGMLTEALADDRFAAPTAHLRQALMLMSHREHPDYRNSIKESISAVEAMAKILAPDKTRATLGDAIYVLEKEGRLHNALREGFSKLYGYTNSADGIRHAMMDEPGLTLADARYFLLSCTSFVNYLNAQA